MDIKVNTIINSLEEFIESRGGILFTGNVLVSKTELLDYIQDIRTELPTSLVQASAIYEDREKILTDANERADKSIEEAKLQAQGIIDEANEQQAMMVSEHEIVKKAREEAEKIIEEARGKAENLIEETRLECETMKNETFDFVEEKIAKLENTFSHAKYNTEYLKDEFYKQTASLFHILHSNIEKDHEDVLANKNAFIDFRASLTNSEEEDIETE